MKIVALAGSIVGSKAKTAISKVVDILQEKYPAHEVTLLDLAEYNMAFSDGRNYFEYDGDTKYVTETIMAADALIIGTPNISSIYSSNIKKYF